MQIEDRSLERDTTAPRWCDPITMFIAWLAGLFDSIAKMKRIRHTTRFKANWRDHFANLRQSEWHRDQLTAAGAARLLAGKDLDLYSIGLYLDPPEDYGGPCPRTPQQMNRRFLALARWHADPEAAIRKHARRIVKRERITLGDCPLRLAPQATSPMLRMEEESAFACRNHRSLSSSGAMRRGRWRAPARDGGGSRHCRGPPQLIPFSQNPHLALTRENAPACPMPGTRLSTMPMTIRATLIRLMKRATSSRRRVVS